MLLFSPHEVWGLGLQQQQELPEGGTEYIGTICTVPTQRSDPCVPFSEDIGAVRYVTYIRHVSQLSHPGTEAEVLVEYLYTYLVGIYQHLGTSSQHRYMYDILTLLHVYSPKPKH